jgi:hypothetical protein
MSLVNKNRFFGEFFHLFRDARVHSDYLRISKVIFDIISNGLELHFCGPETNYRGNISAEQRLVVTVGYGIEFIYRKSLISYSCSYIIKIQNRDMY